MSVLAPLGEFRALWWSKGTLPEIAIARHEYDEAIRIIEESVASARDMNYRRAEVMALLSLSGMYFRTKQPALANDPLLDSLELAEEIGSFVEMGSTLTSLARVRFEMGEYDQAVEIAASVLADPVSAGSRMAETATVGDEAARVLERAREVMDSEDYDAADARGRAVPIAVIAKELLTAREA